MSIQSKKQGSQEAIYSQQILETVSIYLAIKKQTNLFFYRYLPNCLTPLRSRQALEMAVTIAVIAQKMMEILIF
jgi:hypothetical protein